MQFSSAIIFAAVSVAVSAAGPNPAMKEAFIEKYIELAKRQTNATVAASNATTSTPAGGAAAGAGSAAVPTVGAVSGANKNMAALAALIPLGLLAL